jgi:hypothetical protein
MLASLILTEPVVAVGFKVVIKNSTCKFSPQGTFGKLFRNFDKFFSFFGFFRIFFEIFLNYFCGVKFRKFWGIRTVFGREFP